MTAPLLLAIDQGTTSTRTIAFDVELRPVASASRRLGVAHPQPGWVEQDPEEILDSVVTTVEEVLRQVGGRAAIAAVGLDNQGETVVAWDERTRRPLTPAIVWQCRRSEPVVERLRSSGLEPLIREVTGLPLDAYFSAGKMTWALESVDAVRQAARAGTLRFGTVDAWLTARLADGGRPRTDPSTASRTQLLSLQSRDWDDRLLGAFGIDRGTLPEIVPTAGRIGTLGHERWGGELPLTAMVCDQPAALAGHAGFDPGASKATYGTGVFVVVNTGGQAATMRRLEASIAWTLPGGTVDHIVQGGVFTAGTLVEWLRSMGLIADTKDLAALAASVPDTGGVEVLPALVGLGAPWYRSDARGAITGLVPGTTQAHVARAALDAIAHRTADIVEAAVEDAGAAATALRVDGGLTANAYLMARQADLLGIPVDVAAAAESTALGTAALAAIGAGVLAPADIAARTAVAQRIEPRSTEADRLAERAAWRAFVTRMTAT